MRCDKYPLGSFQSRFVLLRRELRWQPPRRSWSEQRTNFQSSHAVSASLALKLSLWLLSKWGKSAQKGTSGTTSFVVGAACTAAMRAIATTIKRNVCGQHHLSVWGEIVEQVILTMSRTQCSSVVETGMMSSQYTAAVTVVGAQKRLP